VRVGVRAGILVLVTIPVAVLLVPTIFGGAYRDGRAPLAILLAATAVTAMAAPLHPIYISMGRDRTQAGIHVGAALLNVGGNLLLIPRFGMTAAASTTVAAQVLLLAAFAAGTARTP